VLTHAQARALVQERLGVAAGGEGSLLVVETTTDRWLETSRFARETLGCVYFSFLSAVDWKEQGLEVVARVENLDAGFAVFMKAKLGAGETRCPSLCPVWRGADWMERECYDMFGIRFEGHPDPRRLLLYEEFEGHPLRKDYPVNRRQPLIGPKV
jgi:NADH-quinone oxidoreductase subunit C